MMPDRDGYDTIRKIRKIPGYGESLVLVLSSSSQSPDASLRTELGINGSMRKPVIKARLLEHIQSLLGQPLPAEDSGRPAPLVPATPAMRSLKVLLAEDNPVNQKVARTMLEKAGHRVTVAADGLAALACHAVDTFDLILMDVQMPEMDGWEATRAIREREAGSGRHIPILAMTAHAMKGDREKCLDAGMDGYVSKPVVVADLRQAIQEATSGLVRPTK